jgi:ribosomal protein S6--L-glutamate ligase
MKPFRLAILGRPDGWYVHDLRRAAIEQGRTSIDVLTFSDLEVVGTRDGRLHVFSRYADADSTLPRCSIVDSQTGSSFDAMLIRTMPTGSLEQVIFRMNALHAAQSLGVCVVNSPRSLEIAIDKWLTLDMVRRVGLAIPATIVCQTRESAMEAFEKLRGDVVVKPLFGGEGRGIMRVNHPEMAWRVFSTLEQIGAVAYVQEFVKHPGFDLRLLVIGKKVFCVARHAPNGDWRTNLSKGGRAMAHEPTSTQIETAIRAAEAVGGSIVGVDVIRNEDGRDVVLEVNAVPGWRGTAKALNIDIARLVLEELSRIGC